MHVCRDVDALCLRQPVSAPNSITTHPTRCWNRARAALDSVTWSRDMRADDKHRAFHAIARSMEKDTQAQPMFHAPQMSHRSPVSAALAVVIVLGVAACAFMAKPFLGALVWSTTLAVLFTP